MRRCRNMAKPLMDLQQGCSQGPCPELPRAFPGRTTSSAVVLGWYASPWQQVHYSRFDPRDTFSAACAFQLKGFQSGAFLPHARHRDDIWDDENHSAKSYKEWFYVNCGARFMGVENELPGHVTLDAETWISYVIISVSVTALLASA